MPTSDLVHKLMLQKIKMEGKDLVVTIELLSQVHYIYQK